MRGVGAAAHDGRRLARVGRDAGQRSLSAAAGILVGAVGEPEIEMGVRLRRRKRRGRQPDDRRRSRVRRQRIGPRLRARSEGRLHALDVQGGRRRPRRDRGRRRAERRRTGRLLRRPARDRSTAWTRRPASCAGRRRSTSIAPRGSPARRCSTTGASTCRCRRAKKAIGAQADLRMLHVSRQHRRARSGDRCEQVWRTYMIAETPTPRAKNAKGTQLWGPSGAAVWSAPTVDPVTKSLYVATGDAYSMPAAPTTDAIVALDLETGAIKWATQVTAGDAFTMACGDRGPDQLPGEGRPGSRLRPVADPRHARRRQARDRRGAEVRRRPRLRSGSGRQETVEHDGRPRRRARRHRVGIGQRRTEHVRAAVRHHVQGSDAARARRAESGSRRRAVRDSARRRQAGLAVASQRLRRQAVVQPGALGAGGGDSGAVFGGSIDGHFRAFATSDGHVLWDFDTARDFDTVNGVKARGGSIDVGGAAIANGMVADDVRLRPVGRHARQRAAGVLGRRKVSTKYEV